MTALTGVPCLPAVVFVPQCVHMLPTQLEPTMQHEEHLSTAAAGRAATVRRGMLGVLLSLRHIFCSQAAAVDHQMRLRNRVALFLWHGYLQPWWIHRLHTAPYRATAVPATAAAGCCQSSSTDVVGCTSAISIP